MRIYHVAALEQWHQAVAGDHYPWSSRGVTYAEQGFVHASFAAQVGPTLARFYADAAGPLVLLVLDPAQLAPEVRVEGGFPHIYGPLPLAAVVEVVALERGPDGWVAPVS